MQCVFDKDGKLTDVTFEINGNINVSETNSKNVCMWGMINNNKSLKRVNCGTWNYTRVTSDGSEEIYKRYPMDIKIESD